MYTFLRTYCFIFVIASIFISSLSFGQTPLFTETFNEGNGATSGSSAEGIGWTSSWVQLQPGVNFSVNGGRFENHNSKGPGTWTSNPIDVSNCKRIIFSMDYQSSLTWPGSGNMELCNECAGCLCDPYNAGTGGCFNCWDFIYVELILDGNVVYTEIVGTTNTATTYTFSYDQCQSMVYSNAEIKIITQTWANNEQIWFDNISLSCHEMVDVLTFPGAGPFCQTDPAIILGATPTGGSYSGPGISGTTFNPATAGPGMHQITYNTLVNGCPESEMILIEVTPATIPQLDPLGPFCLGDVAPDLPNQSANGLAGTWNPAVINTSLAGPSTYVFTPNDLSCSQTNSITITIEDAIIPVFDAVDPLCQDAVPPVLSGSSNNSPPIKGTWSPAVINTGTPGTSVYTFTPDAGQCATTQTLSVTIVDEITPIFSEIGPLCKDSSPPELPTTSENNPGITGTWSPANINTGTPGIVEYIFTPDDVCAAGASLFIEIVDQLEPIFDPIGPICQGVPAPELPAQSNNNPAIQGTWNPASINTGMPGTSTYVFTPAPGQCATSATLDIEITEEIVPLFDAVSPQCQHSSPVILPSVSNNQPTITGSWQPANVDMGTPGTSTYTFTPNAGLCAANTTLEITILQEVIPEFTQIAAICAGSAAPDLPNASNNTPAISGSWNPATIDTQNSGLFTYTFTPDPGQCAAVQTMSIEIMEQINPVFDPIGPLCQGDQAPTLPGISNNNPGISGEWSPTVINTEIPGNYEFVFTPDPGFCANSVSMMLEITELIVPVFDEIGPLCLNNQPPNLPGISQNQNPVTGTWNPAVINTSQAGDFTYTFSPDPGQCAEEVMLNVHISEGFDVEFQVIQHVSCAGLADGSFAIVVNGTPVQPLEYVWQGPAGSNLSGGGPFSDLGPGIYAVSISDAAACTAQGQIEITVPDPLELQCQAIAAESIPGANDGSAAIILSGGTAPYSVQLSGPMSQQLNGLLTGQTILNDLTPGQYQILLTDAQGCESTCSFIIQQANCDLTASIQEAVNPLCQGDFNGNISILANSSALPISYTWDGPVQPGNVSVAQNLGAGFYQITVSDEIGCSSILSLTLEDPLPANFSCTVIQQASAPLQSDGIAEILLFSGNAPFQIQINGPLSFNYADIPIGSLQIEMLQTGLYQVILTDANGCIFFCDFNVESAPCMLSAELEIIQEIKCFDAADGIVSASTSGGTAPYSYEWNIPGIGDTDQAEQLESNIYNVTVTDANGCTATASLQLLEPEPNVIVCQAIELASSQVTADGSGSLSIAGGIAPFDVFLSGPINIDLMGQTGPDVTWMNQLLPGVYTIRVVDQNGCEASCELTILSETCDLELVEVSSMDPLCFDQNSGAIQISASGGSGDYSYQWDGPVNPGNTNIADQLSAGIYTITVSDGVCLAEIQIELLNTDPFELLCSATASNPGENDGQIEILLTGGASPYQISYSSPGQSGMLTVSTNVAQITQLAPGQYVLVATDANGCQSTCAAIVNNADCLLAANISLVDTILCYADSSATIQVNVSGAVGSISYSWNIAGLPDQGFIQNLPAGQYLVSITDQTSNCIATAGILITQPQEMILDCSASPVSAPGFADGELQIQISGGTAPYLLEYTGPQNGMLTLNASGNFNVQNLQAGIYQIVVTDANGCTQDCSSEVSSVSCALSLSALVTHPACFGKADGVIQLTAQGATGIVTYAWDGPFDPGNTEVSNQLPAGAYSIEATDEAGCKDTVDLVLTEPLILELLCHVVSEETGSVTFAVNGGTAPYQIEWNGSSSGQQTVAAATTLNLDDLEPGQYSVLLTDGNGCQQTCTFEIEAILDCSDFAIQCMIFQHPAGITSEDGSFGFSWSGFDGTIQVKINTPTGLLDLDTDVSYIHQNAIAGIYSIKITSPDGCMDSCSLELIPLLIPCDLQVMANVIQPLPCGNPASGEIDLQVSGRQMPFTYLWSDGQMGGPRRTQLTAGIYAWTVTDANNCTATGTVALQEAPPFEVDFEIFQPDCTSSNGAIIIHAISGGIGPYAISIDGDTISNITLPFTWEDLWEGQHNLTVWDQSRCKQNTTFNIQTAIPLMIVPIPEMIISSEEGVDISISINPAWDMVDSTAITFNDSILCTNCQSALFTPGESGTGQLYVIDIFGCEYISQFNIRVIQEYDVFIPDIFTPNGDGINDIFTVFSGSRVGQIAYMRIYDRWGEEVFALHEFNPNGQQGWDGNFRQSELNPGVFVYTIEVLFKNGIRKIFAGEVTLSR